MQAVHRSLLLRITLIVHVSLFKLNNVDYHYMFILYCLLGVHANITSLYIGPEGGHAQALNGQENFAEVTVIPVATAGPCISPCRTIYPFLILLFFMTFIVASTQMPLLMIVLR